MKNKQIAVFGGGCFWCTEAIFQQIKGVISVTPGYAGGSVNNPTYDQVSNTDTGHAETVRIEFDPQMISYRDLLDIFWHSHDPTTINRQGSDTGTQYRSIILYINDEQKDIANKLLKELSASGEYKDKIVTQIVPLTEFFKAEEYHQNYYINNSSAAYCTFVISPKLKALKEKYSTKLKS